MCSSFVYIVASSKNGQVFTGTTTDLVHQVWLHRKGAMADAGAPAACTRLVWHQAFDTPQEATAQLERLARWPGLALMINPSSVSARRSTRSRKHPNPASTGPVFTYQVCSTRPQYARCALLPKRAPAP